MEYTKYLDHKKNRTIFVYSGLGGNEYGTFYTNNGSGYHRVKSNSMPMVKDKDEAQRNLDSYAAKNGFEKEVDAMSKDSISSIKKGILAGLEEMEDINAKIESRDTATDDGGEDNSDRAYIEIIKLPEAINTNIQTFDYAAVDQETASFLQDKANRITEIRIKSVMAIGKEFKEAQDRLASHDKTKGIFQAWVRSLGLDPKTAYNYIHGFMYVMENFHNIEDAEKIQPSLLFAISKPSAPQELQEQVISGDITTHKQYKELEEKLKAAEKDALSKQQLYETISKSYDNLEKKNTEHYERTEILRKELELTKEQLTEAQSAGDNEEAERLRLLLQETEDELEDSKKKIEELEIQVNDSSEIATAIVEVEKIPDEVLQELENLRAAGTSMNAANQKNINNTEVNVEVKIALNTINVNIMTLAMMLSKYIDADEDTISKDCIHAILEIKKNLIMLKNASIENLNINLFDFIKD